jgi:hypothetical protein
MALSGYSSVSTSIHSSIVSRADLHRCAVKLRSTGEGHDERRAGVSRVPVRLARMHAVVVMTVNDIARILKLKLWTAWVSAR